MTLEMLLNDIENNHFAFIDYINSLTEEQFITRVRDKWTPGQQLQHILISIEPIAQVLGNKEVIVSKFGKVSRDTMNYETVREVYLEALGKGGKAPARFEPGKIDVEHRNGIIESIKANLVLLRKNLSDYTDQELNSLALPHPLLGLLTIMEMLYMTSYHITHHHKATKINLLEP